MESLTDEHQRAISAALRVFRSWYEKSHGEDYLLSKISLYKNKPIWHSQIQDVCKRRNEIFLPDMLTLDNDPENKQVRMCYDIDSPNHYLMLSRYGRIVVDTWELVGFALEYDEEAVRIDVVIEAEFYAYLGQIDSDDLGDYRTIARYRYRECLFLAKVPIIILRLWMKGKPDHAEEGVSVLSTADNHLKYSQGAFPIPLFRLFKSLGKDAPDVMLNLKYVSPEAHEIITKELRQLSNLFDSSAQEQVESQQASSADARRLAEQGQHPRISQAVIDNLKVTGKDKQKLAIIAGVNDYLSNAQWSKLFGFSGKSSAFELLNRLQKAGLISLEKTRNGVRATLTGKGKGVLYGSI